MVLAEEKAAAMTPEAGFNPKKFISEVIAEMKKVSWVTRRELAVDTAIVAVAVVIVCALIWDCKTVFNSQFTLILR